MRFEWDSGKDQANRAKHAVSFLEASELFSGGVDCLEIYDEAHSLDEDRFIAVGPIRLGVIVVVYTVRPDDVARILSARNATKKERDLYETYWRGKHGRRNSRTDR